MVLAFLQGYILCRRAPGRSSLQPQNDPHVSPCNQRSLSGGWECERGGGLVGREGEGGKVADAVPYPPPTCIRPSG